MAVRRRARMLNEPYGVVVDRTGTIYFADRLNRRVRRIDPSGTITTFAGDGSGKYSGDGGPAAAAGLAEPNGLALDAAERLLFIADVADHRVRVVDLSTGIISTFAGTGEARHDGDGGPAARAGIFGARAVALAPDGSLYVMERQGSSIRRVRDGIIETVAGTGARGYAGDGGDARQAVFNAPKEMAVDRERQHLRRGHGKSRDPLDRCSDLDRHDDRRQRHGGSAWRWRTGDASRAGPAAWRDGWARWRGLYRRQREPPHPQADASAVTAEKRHAASLTGAAANPIA